MYFAHLRVILRTYSRLPLLSSGQSSWLQVQRSAFDSRHYQIFWEVVGLERGSLSLVSTIEELLVRKIRGSGLESREYRRRDPSRRPHGTLYPQKLALASPTSGGHSVGTVRSRTQAMGFVLHWSKKQKQKKCQQRLQIAVQKKIWAEVWQCPQQVQRQERDSENGTFNGEWGSVRDMKEVKEKDYIIFTKRRHSLSDCRLLVLCATTDIRAASGRCFLME
jgi:hypothetical protein